MCPVARSLDIIGDRWSLLILRDAFDGLTRFKEFQENLGIAKNILTDRLKKLSLDGILESVPVSDRSAYQQYRLTAKGQALFPVIVTLRQWGETQLFEAGEKHSVLVDRQNGQFIQKIEVKSKQNQSLSYLDSIVRKVED